MNIRARWAARFALIAACSAGVALAQPAANPEALTPLRQRNTDEALARDRAIFESWQQRLTSLAAAQPPLPLYHRAKAQAWLDFSRAEYEKNDQSGADQAALEQAAALIRQLEAGERSMPGGTSHPLFAQDALLDRSERVGAAHWELVEKARQGRNFRCVEAEVAKLEVGLLRAEHEAREGNPCFSDEHLREADRLADILRARAEACDVVARIDQLPKFVHFALDSANVSRVSATVLDSIARVLAAIPDMKVQLEGHADQRATAAYNLALSKRRVTAVRDYLVRAGINPERVQLYWYGKSRPRVAGENPQSFARNRCVIFTYIAPKDIQVEVVPLEADLQIETTPEPR